MIGLEDLRNSIFVSSTQRYGWAGGHILNILNLVQLADTESRSLKDMKSAYISVKSILTNLANPLTRSNAIKKMERIYHRAQEAGIGSNYCHDAMESVKQLNINHFQHARNIKQCTEQVTLMLDRMIDEIEQLIQDENSSPKFN